MSAKAKYHGPAFGGLEIPEPLSDAQIDARSRELLGQLTLEEKIKMMSGDLPFWVGMADMLGGGYADHPWVAGAIPRLGIPGVRFVDGPRGVILDGATTFPVSMARGATFDPELEERIGDVIGRELRAMGGNFFGGVCINLLRHPAWGRAQETYGEDPIHLGEFGAALARGVQRHVMACAKHYALNSMENARFTVDVRIEPRPLHEIYLRHFKRVVEEGVASIMSAYNSVNGEYCGQNYTLLTEILKQQWGFQGFVMTDFIFGMRDSKKAALAGQDVEMPFDMIHRQHVWAFPVCVLWTAHAGLFLTALPPSRSLWRGGQPLTRNWKNALEMSSGANCVPWGETSLAVYALISYVIQPGDALRKPMVKIPSIWVNLGQLWPVAYRGT
ncbi:beta-glucosidase-related glycosidase [Anaerolinea thermolimosa]|nr:beta-glucosidase-related glycosidase [Anaerolinea thermolimosa]